MTSSLETRVTKGGILLMVLAFLFEMNTGAAYACTPAPPTPWFAGKLEIISTPVPQNIVFTQYENGSLKLQNSADGTVRIPIEEMYVHKNGFEDVPAGAAGILSWDETGLTKPWQEVLLVGGYVISRFESRNMFGDNRPASPKMPETRIVPFRLIVNGRQIDLQLSVMYRLNEYYVADSLYAYSHACTWQSQGLFGQIAPFGGFLFVGILALAITVYVLWPGRPKEAQNDNADETQ